MKLAMAILFMTIPGFCIMAAWLVDLAIGSNYLERIRGDY